MVALMNEALQCGRPLTLLRAPQCAFGPGPHGYLFQKWTEFLATPATAKRLAGFMQLRCNCPPGAHALAQGRDQAGRSLASLAATYPQLLAECIVYGLTGEGARPAILGPSECIPCSAAIPSNGNCLRSTEPGHLIRAGKGVNLSGASRDSIV